MSYLLDTDTCIEFLRGRAGALRQRLEQMEIGAVFLCSIVTAELRFGAARMGTSHAILKTEAFVSGFPCLPFDEEASLRYGVLRATLAARGELIGPNDLLIASIALARGLTLVTNNQREFQRVPALKLEGWSSEGR